MDQMDCSTSAAAPASAFALRPPPSCIGRIAWPGGPAKRQNFSIPENIIYYMARNPSSPKVYSKLAASCKYFFEQLPLLIVSRICVDVNGKRMCSNDDYVECHKNGGKCCISLDLSKLSSKIWLTKELKSGGYNSHFSSIILSKLYGCQDAMLTIYFEKIAFEEFKLFAAVFQKFCLEYLEVVDSDGSRVMFDSLLEGIANVKEIHYNCITPSAITVTSTTIENVLKLKNLRNLQFFHLVAILFASVEDLSTFVMTYKDTKFHLHFHSGISAEYKLQLDGLIDRVIASAVPNRLIEYNGQDVEKLKIMKDRFLD